MSTGAIDPTPDTSTPAIGDLVDARPCRVCGYVGPQRLGAITAPHGHRIECGQCVAFLGWQAKDALKRRDLNGRHRKDWRQRHGGEMRCHWCLVLEGQTSAAFDIDHILPLEDGGPDEIRNTRPLCGDCHALRHMLVRFQRHMRVPVAQSNEAAA